MKYRYLPMTAEDRTEMLSFLGITDVEDLFSDIPKQVRFKGMLNIPDALSEPEVVKHFSHLAGKNVNSSEYAYFLGAGIYNHYIPSTVNHVISRSEFYTAYTPYQPEISQGELQAIFEFQTMICELTGMDVANSSMYDGPTALAEAANLAVGGAQPFGIPMQLGGPSCGFFAVKEKFMRKIPGRIVGQTVDHHGRRGFVLTLQAREQHIRREKATSNICSNQALNALAASVAMTALGKQGVQEMAWQNVQKTQYAKSRIARLDGYKVTFDVPVFNEFVVQVPTSVSEMNRGLLKRKIVGGYDLGRNYPELAGHMLLTVTEACTKEEIDLLVKGLEEMESACNQPI
ncbi:glycine dehydrogenase [Fodinisporobacter ferrooxydans]|uniref:Glycine dehydrogenase n=1 Tax=Fodinisporobacter ferrooxydans TaxID=2901836 RepID=A0ABY4CFJ6_9BACL|nr:glycine dehydrogenase [Alicyclobacillaceae bacterium MYW30-H2]